MWMERWVGEREAVSFERIESSTGVLEEEEEADIVERYLGKRRITLPRRSERGAALRSMQWDGE